MPVRELYWMIALGLVVGCGQVESAQPGDARIADTSIGDTSTGDANPACGHAGELFCDDFESADLSRWSEAPTGALELETTMSHRGRGALVVTTDGSQLAYIGTRIAPQTTGSLHARAWFFVPSTVALNKIDIYNVNGSSDGVVFLVDMNELRAYSSPGGGAVVVSGMQAPRDQWFCIEYHIDISRTSGAVKLDLNGTTIGTQSAGIDTLPSDGYVSLTIGMTSVIAPQSPVTFYIDDVAAGTQPLGCS